MDLNEAIRQDNALDFMSLGYLKETHVECYRPEYQDAIAQSWDAALELVKSLGSIRKARNFINGQIDAYRN